MNDRMNNSDDLAPNIIVIGLYSFLFVLILPNDDNDSLLLIHSLFMFDI